jgi:hypothetical protein
LYPKKKKKKKAAPAPIEKASTGGRKWRGAAEGGVCMSVKIKPLGAELLLQLLLLLLLLHVHPLHVTIVWSKVY